VLLTLNNVENYVDIDTESFNEFMEAMNDDLNTPNAYSAMYKTASLLNQELRKREKDYTRISSLMNSLNKMKEILGLTKEKLEISDEDKDTYFKWEEYRNNKEFDKADELRKVLEEKGLL